eukprot:GHVP01002947.1.p1 GENE.GHVP01002947.1~~GHVP01002947.1.p1  ORF type:complete len:174 (+),score=38.96 GHVP01002947.1:537-1058(+)
MPNVINISDSDSENSAKNINPDPLIRPSNDTFKSFSAFKNTRPAIQVIQNDEKQRNSKSDFDDLTSQLKRLTISHEPQELQTSLSPLDILLEEVVEESQLPPHLHPSHYRGPDGIYRDPELGVFIPGGKATEGHSVDENLSLFQELTGKDVIMLQDSLVSVAAQRSVLVLRAF